MSPNTWKGRPRMMTVSGRWPGGRAAHVNPGVAPAAARPPSLIARLGCAAMRCANTPSIIACASGAGAHMVDGSSVMLTPGVSGMTRPSIAKGGAWASS